MCDGSTKQLRHTVIGDAVACYSRGAQYAFGGSAERSCCNITAFAHTDLERASSLLRINYVGADGRSAVITASGTHIALVATSAAAIGSGAVNVEVSQYTYHSQMISRWYAKSST